MKRKKLILLIIAVFLLSGVIYQIFLRKKEPKFNLAEIKRGEVVQTISETGTVKKGEEINLSFKIAGRIEKIFVNVGDNVKTNEALAELDKTQILFQLEEARAVLEAAQATFNKIMAGSTPEEIEIVKTELNNAKTAFLNTLEGSYLKADNALNGVILISRTYFQIASLIAENKIEMEKAVSQLKSAYDLVREESTNENIENALSRANISLTEIGKELSNIRVLFEKTPYCDIVGSTDKTSIDTQRANINTAKLSLDSANSQFQLAKNRLSLLTAEPRQEDINFYQAQIKQAQTKIQLLNNQIEEANLKAPVSGQIKKVHKKEGEIVQSFSQDIVISLLPDKPFQIKTDIYEEDVVKIKIGNPVDISLISFPDEIFKGKIISIEPAEKIKEGVVYYEVTIDFENIKEGLKPGMTADLIIETGRKENVLIVPKEAVKKINNRKTVRLFKEEKILEQTIEIGLEGERFFEVISGLNEGDRILID